MCHARCSQPFCLCWCVDVALDAPLWPNVPPPNICAGVAGERVRGFEGDAANYLISIGVLCTATASPLANANGNT